MKNSRRDFIKKTALATAGAYIGSASFSAKSYGRIPGAQRQGSGWYYRIF